MVLSHGLLVNLYIQTKCLIHRNHLKFIMQPSGIFDGLSLDLKSSSTSLPAISVMSQGTTELAHKLTCPSNVIIPISVFFPSCKPILIDGAPSL